MIGVTPLFMPFWARWVSEGHGTLLAEGSTGEMQVRLCHGYFAAGIR